VDSKRPCCTTGGIILKEKKDALKGRKVFIYSRVSTEEQKGTLKTQTKAIERGLANLGFKGKAEVFEEQESGTKIDRPVLQELIKKAMSSKRPAVIVVRDIQRFSRDPYDLGELYNPLKAAEIPVLSINEPIVLGTKRVPSPAADLLAPILVAAGGQEVNTRLKQTLQGVAASRAKGVFAGTPLSLFPDEALDPRRELLRLANAGVAQTEGSRRLGKSTSWWRKNLAIMRDYAAKGVLDDWLDTITLIRNYEQEKGEGKGPRAGIKMKTVRRMTSGYLADPTAGFPKPTLDDLNEYFSNFNQYKSKRSKSR
jgi:DNA invertase Pin-like site-specific DNA recombinase